MAEWKGIDLRGRKMRHHPWGKKGSIFPTSALALGPLFSAYIERGGDAEELGAMLNDHLPTSDYCFNRGILGKDGIAFSLEFQLYCFTFAKIILDDPDFHYRIDAVTPLSEEHSILEQGPMKFSPWQKAQSGSQSGYLSITNMRSMFIYAETTVPLPPFGENLPETEARKLLSTEVLEFLNECAPEGFQVERSFFDTEEILISGEYLYYLSSLMMSIFNEPRFIFNSMYYGSLHGNTLARSIFLQPFLSPDQGFEQWQKHTNRVYDMRFRRWGRTFWATINISQQSNTGMYGIYREYCVRGIQQATSAGYKAFMELSTGKPVRIRLTCDKNQPDSFTIQINWKPPYSSIWTIPTGLAVAAATIGLLLLVSKPWKEFTLYCVAAVSAAVLAGQLVASRRRWKLMATRFMDIRKVINEQFEKLKSNAEVLLRERDSLDGKVRQRTQELEEALTQVQALDKAKTNFIANVSHELRTPLTLLTVPLEGIRAGLYGQRLSADHDIFILIQRNVERLSVQINQLLDFARLDLGTMPFTPRSVPLVAYFRNLIAEIQSLAERKGLALKLENRTNYAELVIVADQALFETALLNLLNNALKFTENGGITISIAMGIQAPSLVLGIEDTGIGFPDTEKDRIFQRFTQLGTQADRYLEGAGLGLALVREIASRHGWDLDACGKPGIGSCFTLTIPNFSLPLEPTEIDLGFPKAKRSRVAGAGLIYPSSEGITVPKLSQLPNQRETILLVEDNSDMGAVLKQLLESSWELCWYRSGRDALAFLDTAPSVSLIICDIMMPSMSGFEFRDNLLKKEGLKDIPFIFLTALADPQEQTQGLEQGALDYIRKPFSGTELLLKIRNILAAQKSRYLQALGDSNAAARLMHYSGIPKAGKQSDFPILTAADLIRFRITPAEARVLELLRLGLQDKEIADRLSVSPRTVNSHLGQLYQKTDTGNRLELMKWLYSFQI